MNAPTTDPTELRLPEFGTDLTAMRAALANSHPIRTVFNGFPAAVAALCAAVGETPLGMVATSLAVGASFDPPMVLFSVRNDSTTWPLLRAAPKIGISVLGAGQGEICRQLGSRHGDRFANIDLTATAEKALFIAGSATWLECSVESETPAGDHTVIVFKLHAVGHHEATTPLIFHNGRFPQLVHDREGAA
jgi:flavin reductase (DIM6/NTAB) family NADH-FMN oxidoreductase RutF